MKDIFRVLPCLAKETLKKLGGGSNKPYTSVTFITIKQFIRLIQRLTEQFSESLGVTLALQSVNKRIQRFVTLLTLLQQGVTRTKSATGHAVQGLQRLSQKSCYAMFTLRCNTIGALQAAWLLGSRFSKTQCYACVRFIDPPLPLASPQGGANRA